MTLDTLTANLCTGFLKILVISKLRKFIEKKVAAHFS